MRGWIQKILIALNWKLNSDSKYTHISGNYISQALESLMCQKLKMLHNFWLMDQKLFWLGSMHTEFYADSDAKWVFSKFSIFQLNIPLRSFELHFAIFRKLRRQKKSKFHFLGQFLTLKNMVTKFFRNSNFSDFLGIKSEINQSKAPTSKYQYLANFGRSFHFDAVKMASPYDLKYNHRAYSMHYLKIN